MKTINSNYLGLLIILSSATTYAVEPSVEMGKALFEQPGANSCMYCHGQGGHGGKVSVAADLTRPKSWKVYKALDKSVADFKKNMEEATLDLIQKGAIMHNVTFKRPYFDWNKAGGTYNAQMLGLGGAPSVAWLERFKDKGVTKDIAAKSAYLYIQTLDTEGVFK
jgi:cytochrome c553